MKKALITGITGQDGAYLAKHLLSLGYEVYGGVRRSSTLNTWRLEELGITDSVHLVDLDLMEFSNLLRVIDTVNPDEIYNLAAQSFVGTSFEQPIYTSQVDGIGVLRLLEVIRQCGKHIKFYQASTSEMFGLVQQTPQSETTPFYPRSPYGVAKLYAHWMTINYRESYDLHASCGILFNHESPMRGLEFVTRKITHTLAAIKYKKASTLELGNVNAKRDWGFAGDYVQGMHAMLQAQSADDYVLATGKTYTVKQFVTQAAKVAGFELAWQGEGLNEVAIDTNSNKVIVIINPKYFRPAEVDILIGNPEKAFHKLDWQPSVDMSELAFMMVEADLKRMSRLDI
jgi:GDPmannose 4,6-dehydratase